MTSTRSRRTKKQMFSCVKAANDTMKKERSKKPLCVGLFSVLSVFLLIGLVAYNAKSSPAKLNSPRNLLAEQIAHQSRVLSIHDTIVVQSQVNQQRLWNFVTPMLIVRPPGSQNIAAVKAYITRHLQSLPGPPSWHVDFDTFTDYAPAPYGRVKFSNIIASTNPRARRKLVLACHYDSKIFPAPQVFVGATDSAAPCAMLMEIAYALHELLQEHTSKQLANQADKLDVALELIFFDGEEAFVRWTKTDSIYGSRHLAGEWKKQNKLKDIDLFVLLDLIGHTESRFVNFLRPRTRWFEIASSIEDRLRRDGFLPEGSGRVFLRANETTRREIYSSIEDDHIPFMNENVPVMHLITVPFPTVWHTVNDNEQALNSRRMTTITQILTQFVAEYLHLRVPPK